jgi:signal transduction histidine kinase
MVTGLDDTESIKRAYEAGATDFITKPINWEILRHRVRYMLRASRAMADLREKEAENRLLLMEAKQAAEELRVAKEAAEAADRTKTEFLATVSHELRTPLNVILGYTQLFLDDAFGTLTPEQLYGVQRVDKNARELLDLISAVLDVSRLEAGRLPVEIKEVQVADLLREIEIETQEVREQTSVGSVWKVQGDLPSLYTDPGKLKVVIKNLIGNAVKFTEKGRITVDAHGRGGLHIVKRLLELLGGRIRVESEVGLGSTFHVWVPMSKETVVSDQRPMAGGA